MRNKKDTKKFKLNAPLTEIEKEEIRIQRKQNIEYRNEIKKQNSKPMIMDRFILDAF